MLKYYNLHFSILNSYFSKELKRATQKTTFPFYLPIKKGFLQMFSAKKKLTDYITLQIVYWQITEKILC